MATLITSSAAQTQEFGEKLGASLKGGEVFALYGDLGSGKTTFVQGIAKGLELTQRIVSPTFLILKTYPLKQKKGTIETFYHADLYRITKEKEAETLGFSEIFTEKTAVCIIEWPEKIPSLLPPFVRKFHFTYLSENEREIVCE